MRKFAFFGPMAYDVAAVIQNLALNYLSHFAHTPEVKERVEFQGYLLALMRGVWTEFARKFQDLWFHNNRGELVSNKYWDFQGGKEASPNFAGSILPTSSRKWSELPEPSCCVA